MEGILILLIRQQEEGKLRAIPETVRLLHRIPGMKSAMFSILAPRKYIAPHRGPYKGVLRYHLGLIIPGPEGSRGIRVGNDVMKYARISIDALSFEIKSFRSASMKLPNLFGQSAHRLLAGLAVEGQGQSVCGAYYVGRAYPQALIAKDSLHQLRFRRNSECQNNGK